MESSTTAASALNLKRSAHATAQAKYRLKNQESEKEKARLRMRRLREQRKLVTDTRGETSAEFMERKQELLNSTDFQDFREYLNKVQVVRLTVNLGDPEQVAEFERLLSRNPCAEDMGKYDDHWVEWFYRHRHNFTEFDEWKEELLDYRDIIAEHTPEELDQMQLEARAKLKDRRIILACGGF